MGGAGRKTIDGNALTQRVTYRHVTVADPDVDRIPEIIDTRVDDNGKGASSGYGDSIVIYVLLRDGATGVTLSLWGRGTDESLTPNGNESSSSSSSSSATESDWCSYIEVTGITVNTMLVFSPMPASEYKVMVTDVGGGAVILREAHSA
jgi:hypothetical protein